MCGITFFKITFVWGATPRVFVDREQTTVRHISEDVILQLPGDFRFRIFCRIARCDCLFCGGNCVEEVMDDGASASTVFVSYFLLAFLSFLSFNTVYL